MQTRVDLDAADGCGPAQAFGVCERDVVYEAGFVFAGNGKALDEAWREIGRILLPEGFAVNVGRITLQGQRAPSEMRQKHRGEFAVERNEIVGGKPGLRKQDAPWHAELDGVCPPEEESSEASGRCGADFRVAGAS